MSLTLTLERGGGEVSGSGTNIELDGTIAGGAIKSVEMYGGTEQTTYSGKNLNVYPYTGGGNGRGITFTANSDGTIVLNGQNDGQGNSVYFLFNNQSNPMTLPAGTYYIAPPSNTRVGFVMYDGTNYYGFSANNGYSMTFASSVSIRQFYVQVYHTDVTFSNLKIYPMLTTSAQHTEADYEPYVGGTASPNPDYPQEVQTVTGEQTITVSNGQGESQVYPINLGKNLLDESTMESGSFNYLNGGLFANATFIRSQQIPCEPNTTYAFSSNSNLGEFAVVYYAADKTTVVPGEGYIANYRSTTFTTPATARYMRVKVGGSANPRTLDGDWDLQIERGSTATAYAPYFTPIELCKIGTYQDYIYKSGEDWYLHKEINKVVFNGSEAWGVASTNPNMYYLANAVSPAVVEYPSGYSNYFTVVTRYPNQHLGELAIRGANKTDLMIRYDSMADVTALTTWFGTHNTSLYYPLATPTDTQITNADLIAQLDALNEATTYDGTTVITVASENLAGSLEVTVSSNIAKTYTEVEIGSPFTITDVEGKSSNTTLDGNVYVDWAYNKKQYSFDLFNLTPQDYADIRAFYDYQFNNSAFPTITVPELNIDKLPVYMEISSRNIINQCLLTDKLTIKFRETVQP